MKLCQDVDIDCIEEWPPCTTACETNLQPTITAPSNGNGVKCTDINKEPKNCKIGDGACKAGDALIDGVVTKQVEMWHPTGGNFNKAGTAICKEQAKKGGEKAADLVSMLKTCVLVCHLCEKYDGSGKACAEGGKFATDCPKAYTVVGQMTKMWTVTNKIDSWPATTVDIDIRGDKVSAMQMVARQINVCRACQAVMQGLIENDYYDWRRNNWNQAKIFAGISVATNADYLPKFKEAAKSKCDTATSTMADPPSGDLEVPLTSAKDICKDLAENAFYIEFQSGCQGNAAAIPSKLMSTKDGIDCSVTGDKKDFKPDPNYWSKDAAAYRICSNMNLGGATSATEVADLKPAFSKIPKMCPRIPDENPMKPESPIHMAPYQLMMAYKGSNENDYKEMQKCKNVGEKGDVVHDKYFHIHNAAFASTTVLKGEQEYVDNYKSEA